jgi:hypothetical protein
MASTALFSNIRNGVIFFILPLHVIFVVFTKTARIAFALLIAKAAKQN